MPPAVCGVQVNPGKKTMEALSAIRELSVVRPVTVEVHERGIGIAERYGYSVFDAVLIASAVEAGCEVLYSEDMQDKQKIEGVTIRNPFRNRDQWAQRASYCPTRPEGAS